MNNLISYKGYKAKVEYSADDDILVGRIIGIDEIIAFHAKTIDELKSEMKEMVKFYLEVCKKKGVKPRKTYSGKVFLRLPVELHARIAETAEASGKSINEWGREVLEKAV